MPYVSNHDNFFPKKEFLFLFIGHIGLIPAKYAKSAMHIWYFQKKSLPLRPNLYSITNNSLI